MAFQRVKKIFHSRQNKINRPIFSDEKAYSQSERHTGVSSSNIAHGHPVDTLMQENRYAEQILRDMKKIVRRISQQPFQSDWNQLLYLAKELKDIELHYRRIETVLFPLLEHSNISRLDREFSERYEEVKRFLRNFSQSVKSQNFDTMNKLFYELSESIRQVITDEDQILYPTALSFLSPDEWKTVRSKSASIGYAWTQKDEKDEKTAAELPFLDGFHLGGGFLTLDMIDLLLDSVLAEVTVFNKDGVVVYFNRPNRRRYPRKQDLIGKPLKEAFSGKNYTNIKKILSLLKSKKVPFVEFWFPEGDMQIYTRYVPLFDNNGNYNGAAELIIDVSQYRRMTGSYSSLQ